MAINSYFYDSVNSDRPYSAKDFATAFGMGFETGFLIRETQGGRFGFDIGGTNYTTIYEGKAIIEGHFVEVTGTEILTVPSGTYSGQIVLRLDADNARNASLVVKTDRSPIQTPSLYELPAYDANVTNGIITSIVDKRYQGGAVPNNHNHKIAEVEGLQSILDEKIKWVPDINGARAVVGKYNGTGKDIVLYLTTVRPTASPTEHRVWIQIDNF
jgi:hypothetical protein